MERLLAALGACCALILHPPATAGPLTPPGAPAPTMKTLDQVEPSVPIGPLTTPGDADALYVITQPGAYHLTADLIGQAAKHGVQISSADVTLDLRGFTLRGVATGLDGVRVGETAGPLLANIVIRNGRSVGWGGSGVRADRANRASLHNLFSVSNGAYGVLAGVGALVADCTAEDNDLTNFSVAGQSIVERCMAIRGGADGFTGSSTTLFRQCVAFVNMGDGFRPGVGATLVECVASGNQGDGFDAGARTVFERCSSIFDAQRGVNAGVDSSVIDCAITGAGADGVVLADGGRMTGGAVAAVGGTGITAGAQARIDGVTVRSAGVGVSVGAASRVERCLIANIGADGVRLTSHGAAIGNTIDSCGTSADGAGVRATDVANRIEGNSATRCDYGVRLDAAGNVVIGNSVVGATISAFSAPAGNAVGPVLTSATITSAPAPNANFAP
ncbi:MAG: right-handed parallel beta-helix repeat-containing protein [Phycisphaerales bacterium]